MFEKILVPLDGSTLSEKALHPALDLAEWSNGEILLVRVPTYSNAGIPISPEHEYSWPQDQPAPMHGESVDYLREVKQKISDRNVPIRNMVVSGDRAGVIVDIAKTEKADLIIMSTHGRTGISRWILGSVTSRVLSTAACPVMAVHREEQVGHILITLDGSTLSEKAIVPGLTLAKAFSAKVTLLRVLTDLESDPNTLPENIALQEEHEIEKVASEQAKTYLKDLIEIHHTESLNIQSAVLQGPVHATILDFASQNKVDLISMTTHGHSGLHRWIYGSVTEKVLHNTDCAVLIVRP